MTEQTKEQTDRATIFAKWPDGTECVFAYLDDEPESLAERIKFVADYNGGGFVPLAWRVANEHDKWEDLRAESIAAGRVIKLVDGKYVPFGVEPQFTATLDRPAPTPQVKAALDLLEQGFRKQQQAMLEMMTRGAGRLWIYPSEQPAEPKRAPLDWNAKTEFNNFPGYEVTSGQERGAGPNSCIGSGPTRRLAEAGAQTAPGFALAAVRQLVR